jgi:hypothetical protein
MESIIARGADADQYRWFWSVSGTVTAKPGKSTAGSSTQAVN